MVNLATICKDCHKDATLSRLSFGGEIPAYPSGDLMHG
jgi:hypothetical protein